MIPIRRNQPNRGPKYASDSIPAPVGGLNARDAQADMPETDAIVLDNWFPNPSSVDLRGGSEEFASGWSGWVESLMTYNGALTNKIFAAATTSIYNITAGGTISVADVTGLTNARFQYINFSTSGGKFLLAVNGADKLQGYDGTNWYADGGGAHDITGLDTINIISINSFKSRVWLIEKNSTKAWYLPLNSIAGAATSFDLGSLFRLGGTLMGMVTWTVNDTNGMNDYAVFVSSEGEVAVYQGYDPAFASTFSLVGTFRIGRPIGRRFYCKDGSDIILITADGVVPLSKALLTDRSQLRVALSDKIVKLISNDVMSYSANYGWQVLLYPIGSKLIINVPQTESSRSYQYVMNTIHGAWCTFGKTFSPWNAACFELFNDGVYYGTNGAVFLCDSGSTDDDAAITADAKPAFSYFKRKGQEKYFTMARPIFQLDGSITAAIDLNVDFEDRFPTSTPTVASGSSGATWDLAPWDTSSWGGTNAIEKDWQTVNGIGYAAALRVLISSEIPVGWQSTDYVFQLGGIL